MTKLSGVAAAVALAFAITGSALANSNTAIDTTDASSFNNTATIMQTGVHLFGAISQTNFTRFNTATIEQTGVTNTARINQSLQPNTSALINQSGVGQLASISENNSFRSDATVRQSIGGPLLGNNATVVMDDADGSFTTVTQSGTLNMANVREIQADGSSVRVSQTGFDKRATVNQGLTLLRFTTNSTVAIDQSGLFRQTATVNQGSLTADSSNLSALVRQSGAFNFALMNQSGRFNEANILQTGVRGSATVNQTGTSPNFAGRAIVNVTQGGAFNSALVNQAGSGNRVTIVQN
jgi:hypothetical protein